MLATSAVPQRFILHEYAAKENHHSRGARSTLPQRLRSHILIPQRKQTLPGSLNFYQPLSKRMGPSPSQRGKAACPRRCANAAMQVEAMADLATPVNETEPRQITPAA